MIAIVLHLYYIEMWDSYFKPKLEKLKTEFDLYVTISEETQYISEKILVSFPSAKIKKFPNKGQDIGPFLKILDEIRDCDYDFLIKLHTKSGHHRPNLHSRKKMRMVRWRDQLVNSLIGSDKIIKKNIGLLLQGNFKMCGSIKWLITQNWKIDGKYKRVKFIAGTMFMVDFKFISKILKSDLIDEWYSKLHTEYELDNTFTHSVERLLGQIIIDSGSNIKGV